MSDKRAGMTGFPGVALPALLALVAGCSDTSRMNMYIDSIAGVGGTNEGKAYIDSDLVGGDSNGSSPCIPQIDRAKVTVAVEQPGTAGIGPSLDVFITGYRLEYFYNDPLTGALQGPVTSLAQPTQSVRVGIQMAGARSTGSFNVAAVPHQIKMWAVGLECHGVAPNSTGRIVQRMIVRVTAMGEDATGKKLSAQGSIPVYLNDFAPYPAASTERCNGYYSGVGLFPVNFTGYWRDYCP